MKFIHSSKICPSYTPPTRRPTQLRLLYLRQPSGRVSGGYGKPLLMSRLVAEHIRHKLHNVAKRMAWPLTKWPVDRGTKYKNVAKYQCFASSRIFNQKNQDSGGFINDHMILTVVFFHQFLCLLNPTLPLEPFWRFARGIQSLGGLGSLTL